MTANPFYRLFDGHTRQQHKMAIRKRQEIADKVQGGINNSAELLEVSMWLRPTLSELASTIISVSFLGSHKDFPFDESVVEAHGGGLEWLINYVKEYNDLGRVKKLLEQIDNFGVRNKLVHLKSRKEVNEFISKL